MTVLSHLKENKEGFVRVALAFFHFIFKNKTKQSIQSLKQKQPE